MKRTKFWALREEIRERRRFSQEQWSYEIGRKRQEKTSLLLQELKEEGSIHDFLPTGDLSFQDIMEGIDFFIVYIDSTRYKICPLSVTGERWIGGHQDRHPEIPVIAINLSDTSAFVKNKIIEVINNR